jgi:hypothetical protein
MSSLTEEAELAFKSASSNFRFAQTHLENKNGLYYAVVALALQNTSDGLAVLSANVRATYVLLDEVKRLLEQKKH